MIHIPAYTWPAPDKTNLSLSRSLTRAPDSLQSQMEEAVLSTTSSDRVTKLQQSIFDNTSTYMQEAPTIRVDDLQKEQALLIRKRSKLLDCAFPLRLWRQAELRDIENRLDDIEMEILEQTNEYPEIIAELESFKKHMEDKR